ncbi:hypothetical protein Sste5344_005278 [Sporothrix stenoceras]
MEIDPQASACTMASASTALVLFSLDKTDKTSMHAGQDGRTKEPNSAATAIALPDSGALDSSSDSSSTATLSSPTLPPIKPRAYYCVTRLPRGEIEHRAAMGRCTYCDDENHSRTTCASGRLMRRVPKRVLNERLGRSVCPFCGDPDHDKHCKATCPLRIMLQEVLDAKEEAYRNSTLKPTEARTQRTAADALILALERQTERKFSSYAPGPRFNNRPSRTQRSDWRGFSERGEQRKHGNGQDADQHMPYNQPPRKKVYLKRPPMSKTNAPWRIGLVHSVPMSVPEEDPFCVPTSTRVAEQDQVDLIDLDIAPPSPPSASSSNSLSGSDSDSNNSATSTPFTTPEKSNNVPSGTNFKRLSCDLSPPPLLNLLDTDVTEVVWNNIFIPPSNVAKGSEQNLVTTPDIIPEESGAGEDLIDWGIDDLDLECK